MLKSVVIISQNQSILHVAKADRNRTMSHLDRTRRAPAAWLSEAHHRGSFSVKYERTENLAADMFTQATPPS